MKAAIVASALALVAAAPVLAQAVPDNTPVRVVPSGVGDGSWVTGKVTRNKGSGCTMVVLDQKLPGGYTMVALNSVKKMERQEKGAWVDVPVKALLAKETKLCRDAAND
jgi:tripartite-type tricarboxylate transporter receptor subunit TctC